MPLITTVPAEALAAYNSLELRTQAAEHSVAVLKATADQLSATQETLAHSVGVQVQYTTSQAQINGQVAAQQANTITPDITLNDFIGSLGLALALGEATMPDRAIGPVSVTVQSYLTFATGPDHVTRVAGLRLYQPELGTPTALATTSFELSKVAPQPGTAAPRALYSVLLDKQNAFADPFWTKFASGTPPAQPAQQIVGEIVKIFANIGAWSFSYLIQEAATIAGLEKTLAGLLAGSAPAQQLAGYTAVVGALTSLTTALSAPGRSNFVAGDLFALTAALDATTKVATTLHP
jgi:hypothetical protein